MPEPSFVFSGPDATLCATGTGAIFREAAAAQRALSGGTAPMIVGALPFEIDSPAALWVPGSAQRTADRPRWPMMPMPTIRDVEPKPPPNVHRARVAEAIERLRAPGSDLHKVVLARAIHVQADGSWDPRTILGRLLDVGAASYGYLVELSAAGSEYIGNVLVGASPELLVCRSGDRVTCRPFAGSAPRSPDPVVDRANARALADSGKNRHEHQLVIDVMRAALEPLCSGLQIAPEPQLRGTDALWHLSTTVTGSLRETSTNALDLALALHPTPAVGGVPTDAATALIREVEGRRGFYSGAIGWCSANGDGRWVVTIRGAQLSADRRSAVARSGGGIVAESDPDDEVDETTAKFRTILTGLGVTL